jgi:hypothetical protein
LDSWSLVIFVDSHRFQPVQLTRILIILLDTGDLEIEINA